MPRLSNSFPSMIRGAFRSDVLANLSPRVECCRSKTLYQSSAFVLGIVGEFTFVCPKGGHVVLYHSENSLTILYLKSSSRGFCP